MKGILIQSINYFAQFLNLIILIRVVLSWLPVDRNSGFAGIIYGLTEPLVAPIRNILYRSPLGGPGMRLDISAIIVVFLIDIIKSLAISIILRF